MRQASWNEIFAARHEPLVLAPEVPREPEGWRRLVWWEDLITFGLLSALFLTVIGAVQQARWVDDMPALYPVAFLGLVMGTVLARVRWPEGFIHLLALPVGLGAVLAQILAVLPGATPLDRCEVLVTRMGDWFGAAFNNGISNDSLPVILLVVTLSWLGAYLSAWAVFRWQNAWLALAPGSTALLMNTSLLPGQFSVAFVFFLFGGALLITRLHLLQRAKSWREDGTPYPPLISLSVLHASFWLALVLIGAAWLLPQADQAKPLESLWHRATSPVTDRTQGLARLFVSVNTKKGFRVHSFSDTMAFKGDVELSDALVLEILARLQDQPGYLRAKSYDVYSRGGWRQSSQDVELALDAGAVTNVDDGVALRRATLIQVLSSGRTGETILTQGQPRRVDRETRARAGLDERDVTDLVSTERLRRGDAYDATGSISIAPEEALRNAGTDYPAWALWYLQLPAEFPQSVRSLAQDLTRDEPTPYDQALAIESYLRQIPYDLSVPAPPPGADAVDYFLFDAKRGFFDYHASAMVVMLRSVGVPARLAVGYVLNEGQRPEGSDSYLVSEESAYAWPEVYFPGLGWVEFNPTPNLPTIGRPGSEPSGADVTAGGSDPQPIEPLDFGSLSEEPGRQPEPSAAAESTSDRSTWVLIGVLAGLAAVAAAGLGGLSFAWVRGLSGLDTTARLWGQTVRLASWARLPPEHGQTPQEYARSLQASLPDLDGVDTLAHAYVRRQYGRHETDQAEQGRLEQAWRAVRGVLVRRLLHLR